MPDSDKPKNAVQQHRSSTTENGDDPRQAAESGEPEEASRSRGRVIDETGKPAGDTPQKGQASKGEHWESGRHNAE